MDETTKDAIQWAPDFVERDACFPFLIKSNRSFPADAPPNFQPLSNFIWFVADLLRGP